MGDASSRVSKDDEDEGEISEAVDDCVRVDSPEDERGVDPMDGEPSCDENSIIDVVSSPSPMVPFSDAPTEDSDSESASYSTPCSLRVVLISELTGERQEKEVTIDHYPKTGIALKRQLEAKFKIPVCVQKILFFNMIINNGTVLKKLRLRSGDTIIIEYSAQVDIEYFSNLIEILSRISSVLRTVVTQLLNGADITYNMHEMLESDCMSFTGDQIPLQFFSVFPTGTPNANQLYFIHNKGLDLLLNIYQLIHQLPWHELPCELQELEYSCLQILWNFSATLGIRHLILQKGIMSEIFQSILRTKVIPFKPVCILAPLKDPFASTERSTYVLAETVYASIVIIGNFAEIPQCRVTIASNQSVIDNMMGAMLSNTYTYTCARSAMCALLCISFGPETHQYLSEESILNRILEICYRIQHINDSTPYTEKLINQTLIKFYALIFFANLLHHQREDDLNLFSCKIKEFMESYISNVTHTIIHQRMKEKRYYWSTFIPFLSLCYSPQAHKVGSSNYHLLCINTGLLSMKCMCIAENAEEIISHEGLQDFITCVSWFMPDEDTTLNAKSLVSIAHKHLNLQPPSLSNIVKSYLASHCCGLEKVLKCDIHSILLNTDNVLFSYHKRLFL